MEREPGCATGVGAPAPWSREWDERVVWDSERWADRDRPTRRASTRPAAGEDPAPVSVPSIPVVATTTGEVVLVGVVTSLLVVVALVASVAALRSRTSGTDLAAPTLAVPERLEPSWSVDVDGTLDHFAVSDGVVVIGSNGSGAVHGHDADTGAELWSLEIAAHPVDVQVNAYDDTVVVTERSPDGSRASVRAIDLVTGEQRWAATLDGSRSWTDDRWVHRLDRADDSWYLRFIDPSTGRERGTVVELVDRLTTGSGLIAHQTVAGVDLYGTEAFDRLAGPVDVEDLESIVLIGDQPVGFDTDDRAMPIREDGTAADAVQFESAAFGDFRGRAHLLGSADGHDVGVISSGSSWGVRVRNGTIVPIWQVDGRVGQPVPTAHGPVAAHRLTDETGEVNDALIDVETGEMLAVTDDGTTREFEPLIAWNGYLVAPEVGSPDRELTFVGFDGAERWTLPLAVAERWLVGDGVIATAIRDGGHSTVTIHRAP